LHAYSKSRRSLVFLAATFAGVAVAMKYNAAPSVLAVWGFYFLFMCKDSNSFPIGRFVLECLLMLLLSVVVFLLICPFPIIDPSTFWVEIGDLVQKSGQTWPGQEPVWSGFLLVEALYTSEGYLGLLFALLGIGMLIQRKQFGVIIFPLLYTLLVITQSLFFMRFAMPLLPWMAVFAAVGIDGVVERYCKNQLQFIFGIVLLAVLTLVQPLAMVMQSNWLFHQPNTRVLFLKWLATERIPEDQNYRIAVDQFSLPIVYRGGIATPGIEMYEKNIVPIDQLAAADFQLIARIESPPIEDIALSTFATFPAKNPDTYPERRQAIATFTGKARPEKVFQPFIEGWHPQAADVEDTYHPVNQLWNRRYPGPVIEVFPRDVETNKE